jgi:putative ABC transport system permease protein
MLSDLRYAVRLLLQAPGFTAVAVLTLGLGIGANTAIFSVVNALLLRPLPLHDPQRLLFIRGERAQQGNGSFPSSLVAYETIRDRNHSLSGLTAFCGQGVTLTGAGDPEQLTGARVTANFFDVLHAQPLLGRGFLPAEGEPGGQPVALIGYGLWQRRYAADPGILGKPIVLSQEVHTIIGVMPPEFPFPYQGTEVWVSRVMNYSGLSQDQIQHGAGYLMAIGRLKPGALLSQADAEVRLLGQQYRQEHPGNPDADPLSHLEVEPLQDNLVSDIKPTLLILSGAVGFVLLIACANVAGLTLARATSRGREIALRAALGAGRGTLIRQLLCESLLLSASGAIVGVLLARWAVALLANARGLNLPGFQPILVDLRVLAFTVGVSLFTGVFFGLLPALQVSRPDLNAVLRDSGWGTTGGARRHRMRNYLVAGQMALSIVLLVGAGLLIESFRHLQSVRLGFDPHHGLTMRVSIPAARYGDDPHRARFVRALLGRVQALPGVESATASLGLPLAVGVMAPFLADGQPVVPTGSRPVAVWNGIAPDYFKTLGIPLLRGRDFNWADDETAPARVIVSDSLARRYWPNEDPLGKHIKYARREVFAEIVGVAGDVRSQSLESDSGLVFYTPYPQFAWPNLAITVRAAGNPPGLANSTRAQVFAADRDLPVVNVRTLEDVVDQTLTQRRHVLYVIGGFAAAALLLAAIGLYGVMAYSVAQRTAEIGIRQAIGARRSDILAMVLGQGLRLSLIGLAAGALASAAMTRLISGMLYHVSATDPAAFAVVSLVFLVVALAASYLPARRATRVDPLQALRSR